MGILKRRTRLVSFRLSDDEYQALLTITEAQGARSISDFSRTALCQAVKAHTNPLSVEPDASFPGYVRDLIKSMQDLGRVITKLSGQIERDLRPQQPQ